MQQEYLTLFTTLSKAIETLENLKSDLMAAQYAAEEQYISKCEPE